ncbi:hypothetical protein OB919_03055 [Halobacteria archaeon AArc-curdl1]|uniref:Uncharacterized protein n=1 Tax=Natronosalvus hydrolyticus TaxID=2979988 RepID=A0AAP3E625_9EURY|nr:hypothetical protein [Halobacteria archaeon AArc-curdl1]
MQFLQFSGSKADWYDSTISGYIVAASTLSIGITGAMAAGVI